MRHLLVIQVRSMWSQGPYEREAGGSEWGRGHDSGSRGLCDALWKWKVAPSQGMRAATRSCKRARKGTPPQACRRGHFRQHSTPPACRRDQFHQHLPLRTSWLQPLDIQNSGRVNLCLSWWWFVKATTGNEYRGIHLWLVQFKIVQGRGLGGEGRFGVHQLRQPLLQDERELGGLLETLKLGTRGQEVGGDSSVGGCKWWASVEPLQEL